MPSLVSKDIRITSRESRTHTLRACFPVNAVTGKHAYLRLVIVCLFCACPSLFRLASFHNNDTVSRLVIVPSSRAFSSLCIASMGTDSLTSLNSLEREQDEDMITNPETVFFLIKLASLNSLESARGQHAISNRKLLCLLLRLKTLNRLR